MGSFKFGTMIQKSAKRSGIVGAVVAGVTGVSTPPDKAALMTAASTLLTFAINAALNWLKNRNK